MIKLKTILILFFCSASFAMAQTTHQVAVGNGDNTFSPANLTITQGDMVTWTNNGGFHNVNGSTATYPGNPVSFDNGAASSMSWSYSFTFDVPGTYDYQCDPHVGLGMTGTITVEAPSNTNAILISGVFDAQPGAAGAKGLELYVLEDIPDLSIFGLGSANNGGGTDGQEFTFPAVSASMGDCIYVADDSTKFADFFGFNADFVEGSGPNTATGINGDDAVELFENGTVIDVFGDINLDGTGEPWEHLDGWAYRKDGTGPDGGTFDINNWTFSGIDGLQGSPTNAGAPVPFTVCNYSPVASNDIIANDDNATTDFNTDINIDVLNNDDLPNGFTSVSVEDVPANGTATVNMMDNSIDYSPDMDFCGDDNFTYVVCDALACDTATVNVTVTCPVLYPAYPIATVTTVDADGLPDSLNVDCQLQGIVHGVDMNGGSSIQFTFIDATGGISLFSSNDYGYTVQEGDEVIVQGSISQFNGLSQISPDTLWLVSSGNALVIPQVVTTLDESTESELVRINGLTIVDPSDWTNSGSGFNVEVTDGTNTYTMRIDNDVDLYNEPAPTGTFDAVGLGGQFDSSAPHDGGYQFLPRYIPDIITGTPTDPGYPAYPIAMVTTIDTDGLPDSLNVDCQLQGIVHGVDMNGGGSIQFTFIDATGGISLFSSNDYSYTVQEGDEVIVRGSISQFNGLSQISPDTLWATSSGNTLVDPAVVTSLDESTESELVRINGLTIVDPSDWTNSGSGFNVEVTDGTNTYTMRIDNDVDLYNEAAPTGAFDAIGIGGQFDNSAPHDQGYQFLPRYIPDIIPAGGMFLQANDDAATTDVNVSVNINVLNNDNLPAGWESVTIADGASNGSAIVNMMDGSIDYTPGMDFCGDDSFTYSVCDLTSCDTATVNISIACPPSYPAYPIATVTTVDADGLPDSIGISCQLQGIVHGIDFQGNDNIQFYFIDATGGVSLFSDNDFGYTVQEGDEVIVQGTITHFNGLSQVNPDTLWMISSGNPLVTPLDVTELNEATESEMIRIVNLSFVDPTDWTGSGSGFNVDVTDGVNTYVMRIDNDVDLYSMPFPGYALFNATGIGGQFDNSAPHDEGYQFLPRYMQDLEEIVGVVDPLIGEKVKFYPNPVAEVLIIESQIEIDRLVVTNLLGQPVFEIEQPGPLEELNTKKLAAGVYIITFRNNDRIWSDQFVKQ